MLKLQADLIRKPTDFYNHTCQIEKIIELPDKEFNDLVARPYEDRGFIFEDADLMYKRGDEYSCLLVMGENGSDGVLIESEGASYVRYGAYVSHARDYVERELERIAEFLLKDLSPDPETGFRSIYLEDIEEYTGAVVTVDSAIARMFSRILKDLPDVTDVEIMYDCMVVMPNDQEQRQTPLSSLMLRDVLLLGGMENVFLVHETADVGLVPASYTAMLTGEGQAEHADLLNASVREIRPGAYGPEIVLGGVDPQALVNFDRVAAAHEQSELMMGPTL